jgi:hypothetical protein
MAVVQVGAAAIHNQIEGPGAAPVLLLPHMHALRAGIRGAEFCLLHASQLSNVEAPQEFAAAVGAFLGVA